MLSKASRAFTEWYHNRGYGYNPVFNEWLCPWWVKLLMPLFTVFLLLDWKVKSGGSDILVSPASSGVLSTKQMLDMGMMCACAQLCPNLCDPMDCSRPGSSVHGDSPGESAGVGCRFLLQSG